MQQILVNFYQFLYRVIPVVIFPTKRWPESTFRCFVDWKLFSTLLKNIPAFLSGNNTKFSQFSADSVDSFCATNLWNQQKVLNLEYF